MAMKGIPSAEIFGRATLGTGEAPKHTTEGHERCAYYVQLGDTFDPRNLDPTMPEGPVTPFIEVECPHGCSAGGAFYSEDYLNELRRTAHAVLGLVDRQRPKGLLKNVYVERLRELTK